MLPSAILMTKAEIKFFNNLRKNKRSTPPQNKYNIRQPYLDKYYNTGSPLDLGRSWSQVLSLILHMQPVIASPVSATEWTALGFDWNTVTVVEENISSDPAMTYGLAHRLTAKIAIIWEHMSWLHERPFSASWVLLNFLYLIFLIEYTQSTSFYNVAFCLSVLKKPRLSFNKAHHSY